MIKTPPLREASRTGVFPFAGVSGSAPMRIIVVVVVAVVVVVENDNVFLFA